jgi:transposase-like protein
MAKIDKVLCPFCIFTSKYVDLIVTHDGFYMCPACNATFTYEELMQLYSLSQYTIEIQGDNTQRNV